MFPGVQGGPLMHVIAAKRFVSHEALQPAFRDYQQQITSNAKALAASLEAQGIPYCIREEPTIHLMLVDLRSKGLNGKQAQETLGSCRNYRE